ncbi:hypothetical protein J41TS12_08400 [Paenibacillus antibioticophila]|uniref:ABC transporter domain-containing protein n=1 Tax=Paenibacillus antibioticophila TaxID=1274374 RepID=A0A920CGD4_9BACL|nr:ABC transporter ATP-binding protein [Paenibacillus antibioticophila]GIO35979.1 hypothetical protein J41TS12_08400 [Paenibacillus antibioticophila]
MTSRLMEIKGLTIKDQSGTVLVDNVSVGLNDKEFVGIVGESGSGKSLTTQALLNVLPKSLQAEYEQLTLMDRSVEGMDAAQIRALVGREIGFVPQNTVSFLHPLIKIKHQIGDAYMHHMKKSREAAYDKACRLLSKVGIKDPDRVMNSYPFQISGGMKQRVNIALALMTDPKVIIADEPTTALDTVIQRQVMDLFDTMNRQEGVPILFISHDLNIIRKYCSRVYVMYKGKLVESGSTELVFSRPEHPYTRQLLDSTMTIK